MALPLSVDSEKKLPQNFTILSHKGVMPKLLNRQIKIQCMGLAYFSTNSRPLKKFLLGYGPLYMYSVELQCFPSSCPWASEKKKKHVCYWELDFADDPNLVVIDDLRI